MATKKSPNLHIAEANIFYWKNNKYTKKYMYQMLHIHAGEVLHCNNFIIRQRFRAVGEFQITVFASVHGHHRETFSKNTVFYLLQIEKKCLFWLDNHSYME